MTKGRNVGVRGAALQEEQLEQAGEERERERKRKSWKPGKCSLSRWLGGLLNAGRESWSIGRRITE